MQFQISWNVAMLRRHLTQKAPDMTIARPVTIAIPDGILADLHRRLDATRTIDTLEGASWDYGMDPDALQALLVHWRTFDWRKAEARINGFAAFEMEVDGAKLHFVHVKGEGKRPIPIILTNGWPSCFTELLPLIPLLTRDSDGLCFDVVIPSLPGYGFSARPKTPGTNITRIAKLWCGLMSALGYDRFLAHGSDMGAGVVERLRANHAGHVMGIHMVNVFSGYPAPKDIGAEEQAFLAEAAPWRMQEGAYAMLHATKPHTIAAGLNDSPAGLAAWIGEKFHAWSGPEKVSLDDICTVLTIYWATQTIASSQHLYREAFADAGAMSPPPRSGVPVGVAIFPEDILPAPRAWGERWLDLTQWTTMPRGGHFPGFEEPSLLAADIRDFARRIG